MIPVGFLQDNAFVSTWKTDNAGTSASNQILIPTSPSGSYSCTILWGDGTSSFITAYNDAATTHTYPSAGTYTVRIYGKFEGFRFAAGGDKLKLLNISQWGPSFKLGNLGASFWGCSNLTITATDILNTSGLTNFGGTFIGCSSLTTIPNIGKWDISSVTTLQNAFNACGNFSSDLSQWNVSNVTDMSGAFFGTKINFSVASWNVSKVTNMSVTFRGCSLLNQDFSSWDVSNVTDMSNMFRECPVFNGNVTTWNVSKVTNFGAMFYGASVFNRNIGSWNVSAATTLESMFGNAGAFNQNIGSWNISKVTNMIGLFQLCPFNQDISGWDMSSVTVANAMFAGATLFNQNISGWNVSKITNMSGMFLLATSFQQNLGNWNIAALTNATDMFTSTTLTNANYNALLAGWAANPNRKNNVTFSGGNSHYDATSGGYNGTAGRAILTTTNSWTITDGGTP